MPNPFDAPSTLPYQLPDFAKIAVADIGPALLAGMEEQRAEIRAITDNTEAPTFANTMEAWERSGQILSRAHIVLANASSADATDDVIALDTAFAPLLAAHHDTIILDAGLFARAAALFESRHELNLDADQLYLLERTHHDMVLRGAALSADAKTRLSEINGRLSTLETQFDNKLQADANDLAVLFDTAEELAGLSAGELSAAATAASERGHEGKYLVTLVLPANNPVIASMSHRESRERIMSAQAARGRRGGEHDTRETLLEIVRLRAERAELLGFANHQELIAAGNTAQTAAAIRERLTNLAEAATRSVRREHDRLVAEAGHDIASYDWAYYSDLVRLRDFDVDETALRPYFEAERVLIDGVFFAATALYGITFVERTDLVGYHPDTRIFEVFEEDGTPIGLYVYDLYTRDTKRGGAWMNELVA